MMKIFSGMIQGDDFWVMEVITYHHMICVYIYNINHPEVENMNQSENLMCP